MKGRDGSTKNQKQNQTPTSIPQYHKELRLFHEGRQIYLKPNAEMYHLDKKCEGLASSYYEEKIPCRLRKEVADDVLNSRVGLKRLGFIHGWEEYQDEDFLIWVSRKIEEKKVICRTCEVKEFMQMTSKEH